MARKKGIATEALTIRLESDMVAVFRELAAEQTLANGGKASITTQDVMREWLRQHPACGRLRGPDDEAQNVGGE